MSWLTGLIPARGRKYVYGVVGLLVLAYGAYQAANGDWKQALAALAGTLVAEMARANTNPQPPAQP